MKTSNSLFHRFQGQHKFVWIGNMHIVHCALLYIVYCTVCIVHRVLYSVFFGNWIKQCRPGTGLTVFIDKTKSNIFVTAHLSQKKVGGAKQLVCRPHPHQTNAYNIYLQPRKLIFGIQPYFNPTKTNNWRCPELIIYN